jgi:hypothetical protein
VGDDGAAVRTAVRAGELAAAGSPACGASGSFARRLLAVATGCVAEQLGRAGVARRGVSQLEGQGRAGGEGLWGQFL